MTTVKFSEVTLDKRSWVVTIWSKITDVFASGESADFAVANALCRGSWEPETITLYQEAIRLCDRAIKQTLPKAGACQQILVDNVLAASTVYSPEEAQLVYDAGNHQLEQLKNHIREIRFYTEQIQGIFNVEMSDSAAMQKGMYSFNMTSLLEQLKLHIDQLENMTQYS